MICLWSQVAFYSSLGFCHSYFFIIMLTSPHTCFICCNFRQVSAEKILIVITTLPEIQIWRQLNNLIYSTFKCWTYFSGLAEVYGASSFLSFLRFVLPHLHLFPPFLLCSVLKVRVCSAQSAGRVEPLQWVHTGRKKERHRKRGRESRERKERIEVILLHLQNHKQIITDCYYLQWLTVNYSVVHGWLSVLVLDVVCAYVCVCVCLPNTLPTHLMFTMSLNQDTLIALLYMYTFRFYCMHKILHSRQVKM